MELRLTYFYAHVVYRRMQNDRKQWVYYKYKR
jgi:hypothetical protein